jgi:hypothetical protein
MVEAVFLKKIALCPGVLLAFTAHPKHSAVRVKLTSRQMPKLPPLNRLHF